MSAADSRLYLNARLFSEYNRGATATVIPTYLCPSTRRTHATRVGSRISDRNGDGIVSPSSYEGFACIDYSGCAGPTPGSIRARYKMPGGVAYPTKTGVLINGASTSLNEGIPVQQITDGLSKTMLLFELTGRGVNQDPDKSAPSSTDDPNGVWASGLNCNAVGSNDPTAPMINPSSSIAWDNDAYASLFSDHPSGAHVAMCDGSVHFLSESTSDAVLTGLASRNCGEAVSVGQ